VRISGTDTAERTEGVQLSITGATAERAEGVQLSITVATAERIEGVQVAVTVTTAERIEGVQLFVVLEIIAQTPSHTRTTRTTGSDRNPAYRKPRSIP